MATDTKDATQKVGRPKGSKSRGATSKKRYLIYPAEAFKPLGEADGINPEDAIRTAFEEGMLKDEANVVIVSERNIHPLKAKAKSRVTLDIE